MGRKGGRQLSQRVEVHPGQPEGDEDTSVAVEHQHHGNSQTEAALFNVNIDLFLKGNDSRSKSFPCVLARSPSHILISLKT